MSLPSLNKVITYLLTKSGKLEENLADDQRRLGVKLIALKVKYVGL